MPSAQTATYSRPAPCRTAVSAIKLDRVTWPSQPVGDRTPEAEAGDHGVWATRTGLSRDEMLRVSDL